MRVIQDFSQGKMNLDVDPRYMPKGQYREAYNVRVIDTDSGNSGVIESMDGTRVVVDEPLFTPGSKVIGMYEYNQKIYMFTALKQGGFSILEHDSVTGKSAHVLVDQLSSLKDVDGLKNTICFLHNRKDPDSIFAHALNEGFGWYIPSKEEIKEVIDSMGSKLLISERDEYIVDFNDRNIGVGQTLNGGVTTRKAKSARVKSTTVYWTSTEIDDTTAHVYGVDTGEGEAYKNEVHPAVAIRRFRFDIPPVLGSVYDNGIVYKVDTVNKEARAFKQIGQFAYDTNPKSYVQSLVTPFGINTEISGFAMINDIMIFHDWMNNEPVEIDTSLTKGYYKYYDWTSMKLVKRPPMNVSVKIAEKSELGEMRNINPLFAARYIYDTKETSAISPYSNASSDVDESSGSKVAYDMMAECYVYDNSITIVTSGVDKETGLILFKKETSFNRISDIQSSNATMRVRDFKVVPYNATDEGFQVKGVICLEMKLYTDVYKGFFLYFDTISDRNWSIVEQFIGYNDGGDLNVNANLVYFARTGGFSGSNNSGLWLQQYNPQDGSYGEVRGFEGDGDKYQGGICMSDSGKYCYISYKSNFSYSHDSGRINTWTENNLKTFIPSVGTPRGKTVICSGDGSVVYVAVNNNFDTNEKWTLVSRDYGKSFNIAHSFPYSSNEKWGPRYNNVMACSSNGKIMVVAGDNAGTVYSSSEYGSNLNLASIRGVSGLESYKVTGISMNDSGRIVFLMTLMNDTSNVFYSSDFGKTFNLLSQYNKPGVSASSLAFVKGGSYSNEILNEISNSTSAVDITVNTGNEHVEKIDILMKIGFGMYKVKTVDKKKEGIADNTEYTYRFSYSGNYPLIATKDVTKLFDNVPLQARSCMIIQNSVLFGGYLDGFDVDTDVNLDVKINNTGTTTTKYSLKTGVTQGYGIIFYDEFGRCSPVLADTEAKSDRVNAVPEMIGRIATISLSGTAPSWAKYFKFARRNPRLYFDVINGFDNAIVINDRVYLEITSMPWIVPNSGDKIELVSEQEELSDRVSTKGYIFEVKDKVTVQGNAGNLEVTLSDGTKVSLGDSEKNDIPSGRYIIIDSTPKDGYTNDDINNKNSRFTSSVFYIIMYKEEEDSVVFQEIPGIYPVPSSGKLLGIYTLDQDGDVMIATNPAREINRFTNGTIFSTLGRPNSISDNYSREDRFASLTVSEPYVEDTKDNGLSSFNNGLINYTDLGKKYGEIVKVDEIGSDVDVYQRNKCSRVMYRKNILNTATGESLVTKSEDAFGEQQEYAEDSGMSSYKTYAKSGNSRFFVDERTAQVLRKSVNGIFPVSSYGMNGYFRDKLPLGVVCGGYDPAHSSYVVSLPDISVNFMEPVDGWTSFYDTVPEWMQKAGGNLYMAKEAIIRTMGGEEYQNLLQGEEVESKIHLVNNEYPDSNKVFNNIIMESNKEPDNILFDTNELQTSVNNMVKKEHLYESYIPRTTTGYIPRLVQVFENDVETDTIQLMFVETDINAGDSVMVDGEDIASVESIDGYNLKLDKVVNLKSGDVVYKLEESGINGDAMRGKYIEIYSYFSGMKDKKLLLKSIQLDIDESKI